MEPRTDSTSLSTVEAWETHASPLLHFLHGMTHDRELAEDLVAETFLRLAREERAGRTPDHTRGWLYRVAANLLASHGRRTQVARREMAGMGRTEPVLPSAETEASAREALREVIGAAAGLSPTERRTLALAAAECTNLEMAAALGVTAEAARTRLCRARAHLVAAMAA
jgi:RNA polymerase sigma-70 factor, ECF subfamily